MAKHTITVIHKSVQETIKITKIQSSQKNTSSLNKTQGNGVSKRNKQQTVSINKSFKDYKKFLSGGLASIAAIKMVKTGVNIYSQIGDAATGNVLYYNNLRSLANFIINPLGTGFEITKERILGDLRVQRENRALEYQRQLTGNLAFSKKTSSGTF